MKHPHLLALVAAFTLGQLPSHGAQVIMPDIVITSIGVSAANDHGAWAWDGSANPPFTNLGSFIQNPGGVTASDGDDLVINILPPGGTKFSLSDGYVQFAVDMGFDRYEPIFGGTVFRSGAGPVVLNGVEGGVAPLISPVFNVNNQPHWTTGGPGGGGSPTGFSGQLTVSGSLGSAPSSVGSGDITFNSFTITIPNVPDMNLPSGSLDRFGLYFTYPTSQGGFGIVPVPEPSSALLLAGGLFGFTLRRRR